MHTGRATDNEVPSNATINVRTASVKKAKRNRLVGLQASTPSTESLSDIWGDCDRLSSSGMVGFSSANIARGGSCIVVDISLEGVTISK